MSALERLLQSGAGLDELTADMRRLDVKSIEFRPGIEWPDGYDRVVVTHGLRDWTSFLVRSL